MVKPMDIGGRYVGPEQACLIIAEAGVNHNGSIDMAFQLVDAAVEAGADAVKFQTYLAESVMSASAPKAAYQKETTQAEESQLDMARKLELPFDAFRKLAEYCNQKQIIFISTPFDLDSADFLADLGVGVIKIPSGEITNLPFLHHIAKKNIPLIVSTGMSNIGEIDVAVQTIKKAGNADYVLLHCVSNYPADPQNINLRSMKTMESAFHVPVGYSDHTLGNEVALAAVAMGACIIEKHFTLDCSLPGPDQQASLEPGELKNMVESIRIVEAALGNGVKEPVESELNTAEVARRSLVAACDISAGTAVEESMISILRPGTGLPPSMYSYLIGRTARDDVEGGTLLTFDMFS